MNQIIEQVFMKFTPPSGKSKIGLKLISTNNNLSEKIYEYNFIMEITNEKGI